MTAPGYTLREAYYLREVSRHDSNVLKRFMHATAYGMSIKRLLDTLRLPHPDQLDAWENEGGK